MVWLGRPRGIGFFTKCTTCAFSGMPPVVAGVALASSFVMGGSDRALLLGLPGLAVLAAFALPTLHRSTSAAIDWFSMILFTLIAWLLLRLATTGSL